MKANQIEGFNPESVLTIMNAANEYRKVLELVIEEETNSWAAKHQVMDYVIAKSTYHMCKKALITMGYITE